MLTSLSIKQAAAKIGIGTTELKRTCRKHGIGKWPWRRIQAVKDLSNIDSKLLNNDDVIFIKEAINAVSTGCSFQTLDYIDDIWSRVKEVKKKYRKYQENDKLKRCKKKIQIPTTWCSKRKRTLKVSRRYNNKSNSSDTAISNENEASTEPSMMTWEPRDSLAPNITAWWNDELHFTDAETDANTWVDSLFNNEKENDNDNDNGNDNKIDLYCYETLR